MKIKKLIIFILIIISALFLYTNFFNDNGYRVIKKDTNSEYLGVGQEKVANKDGYFTTFTTDDNYKKTYKEYKQNGSSSWSNKEYWGSTMAENICQMTLLLNICNLIDQLLFVYGIIFLIIVGLLLLIIWLFLLLMAIIWFMFLILIGLKNDSKSSGWYDIDEITPYLAKAIYIEDYN